MSILVFAASAAMAQDAADTQAKAHPAKGADKSPADGAAKSGTKTHKARPVGHKPAPGHYASESEARSHCRGTVVWVDKDGFNHYEGSREYGRQPGHFSCEKG
ncbi:MAG: hypothetical protein HY765_07315 [Rhodomicrobium sp.]|nr:hypothetical protein [Rhodomicrobium sp.]